MAAVRDVQRAGGVRGHELDEDALAAARLAVAVLVAELMDAADDARRDVFHQEEVDEAGAGDLRLGDDVVGRQGADDGLSQLARIATGRLGQAHGDVGREVAVRGIARALHHDG